MRLAQISDFHITKFSWNPFRLFPKRIFSHLHWMAYREKNFSFEQVELLPELFSDLKVDFILLGGDFTSTSLREEFESATSFVGKFKQPWIAIPGNHDTYTQRSQKKKMFYQYFANSHKTLSSLKQDGVEGHKIAPSLWIVSLDTSFPSFSSKGRFSKNLESKLEKLLSEIPSKDKIVLFNHYPFFKQEASSHSLERGEALEEILRSRPNIVLYLHGHTHRHSVADLRPSGLPIILDSGSCAQTQKGTWNLIDLEEKSCTISTYSWLPQWTQTKSQEFSWN